MFTPPHILMNKLTTIVITGTELEWAWDNYFTIRTDASFFFLSAPPERENMHSFFLGTLM